MERSQQEKRELVAGEDVLPKPVQTQAGEDQTGLGHELPKSEAGCTFTNVQSSATLQELIMARREAEQAMQQLQEVQQQLKEALVDAERMRHWRHIRRKLAPEGSVQHSLMIRLKQLGAYLLTAERKVLLHCDQPDLRRCCTVEGITCIRGWAIAKSGINEIRIFIDDTDLGCAFYGFVRDDVARDQCHLKDINLGFAFRFDSSQVRAGIHTIRIAARANDGSESSLCGQLEVAASPQCSSSPALTSYRDNHNSGAPTKSSFDSTTASPVDISILILARNEARSLTRSLPLITGQKLQQRFEIIGIDTESEDRTVDIFRYYGARTFTVPQRDFHHVRTRLFGIDQARAPIVVFLVADAVPVNEFWLRNLVEPLLQDPIIGASYSRQLPAPSCVPWEARDILSGTAVVREVKRINWLDPYAVENYKKYIWKYIAFSDVSSCYRKDLIRCLPVPEGLSEIEDQYWCKCLLEEGYQVVLEPTSVVIHSHNDSMLRLYKRQSVYGECFSTFTDARPEPMKNLLFHALEASFADLFFLAASRDSVFNKVRWAAQIPVMRFLKRFGFRQGIRRGLHQRVASVSSPSMASAGAKKER